MKILVALEAHFTKNPSGEVWHDSIFGYDFWERYLDVFDEVLVLARVRNIIGEGRGVVASGKGVSFAPLPDYYGPVQFLKVRSQIVNLVRDSIDKCDCAILRVPGEISNITWRNLLKTEVPFGLEVVGDPWDSLAPGVVKSPLRPLARLWARYTLFMQCKSAKGVSYVTRETLQKRYPVNRKSKSLLLNQTDIQNEYFNSYYSSISLPQIAYVEEPRSKLSDVIRIINVGTMETLYKAQDVQIKAIRECKNRGITVKLDLVGDGRCRPELEKLVEELGLNEEIRFLGRLPGPDAVRKELDKADLFILPSRGEGLPRALIEAMALGMPCIATNVSGIPELLPRQYLVTPGDCRELADKICEVVSNRNLMKEMAKENLERSREYCLEILKPRRIRFYRQLRSFANAHQHCQI